MADDLTVDREMHGEGALAPWLATRPAHEREWVATFLRLRAGGSPNTFRRYARDLARLMVASDKPLAEMRAQDLAEFQGRLANPPPALQQLGWPRFRPATPEAVDGVTRVLGAFFEFLRRQGWILSNPVRELPRLSVAEAGAGLDNFFRKEEWAALWRAVEALPEERSKQRAAKRRLDYVLSLQYHQALRPQELAGHTQQAVRFERGQWRLRIEGKGRRRRTLQLARGALSAIRAYRSYLGLAPTPSPDPKKTEPVPLLPALYPVQWRRRPAPALEVRAGIVPSAWRKQWRGLMQAAWRLGRSEDEDAAQYEWQSRWAQLSPHAVRHTRLTHLARHLDVHALSRFAGHSDVNTTARYYHLEDGAYEEALDAVPLPKGSGLE